MDSSMPNTKVKATKSRKKIECRILKNIIFVCLETIDPRINIATEYSVNLANILAILRLFEEKSH
jgi:hypothetical protein